MRTEPSKTDPPKRKRRWFQFSLRTLLAVAAIAAVQCAVYFPMLREWEANRELDEAIRGAKVFSDFPTCAHPPIVSHRP